MYVITRFFSRLKKMSFFHFLLFFEILIGALILHAFLTINSSIQYKYDSMSQIADNNVDNLLFIRENNERTPAHQVLETKTELPFSGEDLSFMNNKFGNKLVTNIKILQYQNYIYNNTIESLFILFITPDGNSNTQDLQDPFSLDNNSVIIGNRVHEIMTKGTLSERFPYQLGIDEDTKQISIKLENEPNEKTLSYLTMHSDENKTIKLNSGEKSIDLTKTIIMPIDFYFQNNITLSSDVTNINISLNFFDSDHRISIKNELLQYLTNKYGNEDITFMFDTNLDQFRRLTADMKKISEAVSALSIFSLLIMGTGLLGLILSMIQKRRRDIAICKAVGASNSQLSLEIILEILTLTLLPTVIAVIISRILSGYIRIDDFAIVQSSQATLITITFSLCIAIAVFLLSLFKLNKVYPITEIKEG